MTTQLLIILQVVSLNFSQASFEFVNDCHVPEVNQPDCTPQQLNNANDERKWVEVPVKAGEVIKAGTTMYLYPGSNLSFRDPTAPDSEPITYTCRKDMAKFGVSVAYDCIIVTVAGKVMKEIQQ